MKRNIFKALYFLVFLLGALSLFMIHTFEKNIEYQSQKNSSIIAREIGESFRALLNQQIIQFTAIVKIREELWGTNHSNFLKVAQEVVTRDATVSAFNLLDPDTTIRWVYPIESNKLAIGKKISDHPTVPTSIKQAMLEGGPVFTPIIRTYQGYDGFILYIPIFKNGKSNGWLNIVMDYQSWFDHFFQKRNLSGVYVKFSWLEDDSSSFQFGETPIHAEIYESQMEILNQKLKIQVAHKVPELAESKFRYQIITIVHIFITLGLLILIYFLERNQRKMIVMQNTIATKNSIISSMTHDFGNPLQLLSMGILFIENKTHFQKGLESIKIAFEKMSQTLQISRMIHADEDKQIFLDTKLENLFLMVEDAIKLMEPSLNQKEIKVFNKTDKSHFLQIHAACFVNHILGNILNNAIKFSDIGSKIEIESLVREHSVVLEIKDWGTGIDTINVEKILHSAHVSRFVAKGTSGEKGLGLGIRQVLYFANMFKAKIEIDSELRSQRVDQGKPSTIFRLIFPN